MVKVKQASTTIGSYAYSPDGIRILSLESGSTTVSLNVGVNVIYEKTTGGTSVVNDYLFADGLLIAKISAGSVYYYHQDHLGNTRLVTVGSSTSFSTNYRAYGLAYRPVGTEPVFKYTGKPQSQSTGLYYYGARWYNTTLGRFLTRDPKTGQLTLPQSLNPYIYVLNNPLGYTDPTGMDWWNPLTWNEQQKAQAFTVLIVAVAVVAVVVTVVTCGATAPLAAAAIGAAVGAASSTALYTVTAGDKATLGGAALSALTGALSGAIGGGAGGAVASFAAKGSLQFLAGAAIAGVGQAAGNQAGKWIDSIATGQAYQTDPRLMLIDTGIGAVTFGAGAKLGLNREAVGYCCQSSLWPVDWPGWSGASG